MSFLSLTSWPGRICLVSAGLLAGFLLSAAAEASEYCGSPRAHTAVVVVHGGGFIIGDQSQTSDTCRSLAAQGFRVVNVSYPKGDLLGAEAAVFAAARQARTSHRRVFAYGESAGGGLALLLAARRLVDGAYAWAPVSDVFSWRLNSEVSGADWWRYFKDLSPQTLRRVSALSFASRRSSPALVVHGRDDRMVPFSQSVKLAKLWPSMRLRPRSGGHEVYEPSFLAATREAGACFKGWSCSWARRP